MRGRLAALQTSGMDGRLHPLLRPATAAPPLSRRSPAVSCPSLSHRRTLSDAVLVTRMLLLFFHVGPLT
eukprot:gene7028-biopygen13513